MDTDHNRGDDDYHQRCSMHMLLASTIRVVEFGFHLVAEDDGWGDDEEGREQQGCSIWSEYQPATAQEYLQIVEAVLSVNSAQLVANHMKFVEQVIYLVLYGCLMGASFASEEQITGEGVKKKMRRIVHTLFPFQAW